MSFARFRRTLFVPSLMLLALGLGASAWGALPKVPEGFEVRLVATVPAVLYPCQVGPRLMGPCSSRRIRWTRSGPTRPTMGGS